MSYTEVQSPKSKVQSRNAEAASKKPCMSAVPTGNQKASRPRVGFLGVGWIGKHRLEGIARSGHVDIVAVADNSPEAVMRAKEAAPKATALDGLESLLDYGIDGVVIATPSARHAAQSIKALGQGVAVFCQKPLGRNASETQSVVTAARRTDLLLGIDLSYRFMSGTRKIHELCRQGELGDIYAADLVFHNAYGPDKAWFYDPAQSGGGCVIDLGIHLVDLALWNLGFPGIERVESRLFVGGKPLRGGANMVEDYAEARVDLVTGTTIRLACSWKLSAGCEAIISGAFYGTKGGAAFRNVNGSFYQFEAERFSGTQREKLSDGAEDWGVRAAVDWAQRLAAGHKFDPAVGYVKEVAQALDSIYQSAGVNRRLEDSV